MFNVLLYILFSHGVYTIKLNQNKIFMCTRSIIIYTVSTGYILLFVLHLVDKICYETKNWNEIAIYTHLYSSGSRPR